MGVIEIGAFLILLGWALKRREARPSKNIGLSIGKKYEEVTNNPLVELARKHGIQVEVDD